MTYPTFLINLDEHAAKRTFMEAQFDALGLPLVRLQAALGRDPAVRAAAAVASYATLTDGEIGCFESHRRFWQRVIDDGLPGAYVIEDDVVVASDYGDLTFSDDILQQADVIKIDQGVRNVGHYGTTAVPISRDRDLVRLLGTEFSTGCYFVTKRGAARLLAASEKYFVPVDRFMFDQDSKTFWTLSVWKLDPSAAVQFRLFDPKAEAETELGDSISANRISGREATPGMTAVKQWTLRARRLLDWDFRRVRQVRRTRNLADFAQSEPVLERAVGFQTKDDAHVAKARQHLKRAT